MYFRNRTSLAATLVALASLTVTCAVAQSSSSIYGDDEAHFKRCESRNDCYEVDLRGDIEFLDDDSGVKKLSRGGYLNFKQREGRNSRSLEIRSERGEIVYVYRVNGRRIDIDGSVRDDIADLMLMIIRETGINARERVARILKEDGPDGVFEEIEQIDSSSSNSSYFIAFVELGKLGDSDLRKLVRMAPDQIASSGSRARFLIRAAPYYVEASSVSSDYFDVVTTIPSSGDHTRVLMNVLELDIDRKAFHQLLNSARSIASSGDKSRLLIKAAAHYENDADLSKTYFQVVDTIPSSGDHTRVLMALLNEIELDEESATALFRSVRGIASSGDKARLLSAAAPLFSDTAAQRKAFFEAVNEIPSSGDHTRVLLRLLDSENLNRETLLATLQSAKNIASSGDKTRILLRAADLMVDDDLVDRYLSVAESIQSSGDQSRALTALLRNQ